MPHVRQTVADRELETWVVVDLSPSLDFGTTACEKRDLAVAALAAVAHLTRGGGNRIGAIVATGERLVRLPARGGRRLRAGAGAAGRAGARSPGRYPRRSHRRHRAAAPTSPAARSGRRHLRLPRRARTGSATLRALSARHELLAVEVLDPRELELPDVGTVVLADPETGRQREVVTTPLLCREFAAAAAEHRERVAAAAAPGGRRAPAAAHGLRLDRRHRPLHARPQAGLVGRRAVSGIFTDPLWLAGLLVVALLVAAYVVLLRRRRRDTMLFTNLELLERIAPHRPGWYRHVPAAALIVALALLTIALAGPQAEAKVPRNRATVVLVIDVSLSMQATDVTPSRLAAAQVAAKAFADQLTPGVNLGLVSFAGTAAVLVSPTTDREPVKRAVDGLKLAESTATGDAILAGLQSIETFSQAVAGASGDGPPPARIVLMSDGGQTVPGGPGAEDQPRGAYTAARKAAEAHVPVSTISFGTDYGTIELDPDKPPVSVAVDDEAMRRIAELSGGQFFTAASESELRQVYAQLGEQIGYELRKVDVSRPWLAGGALMLFIGVGAGIGLGRRLP